MTVLFAPAATRTEVADVYRGAAIEVMPGNETRTATTAEADELRELVSVILPDAIEADRAEALAVVLADPVAALACFRALADRWPRGAGEFSDTPTQ